MSRSFISRSHRNTVRKITLAEEGMTNDYGSFTPEQRVLMVWPLTLTAWKFKDPNGVQRRLPRHVGRVERR